jgi:hypothetical protein
VLRKQRNTLRFATIEVENRLKPDSHMSPTSAMPLFEISEEEHGQKILLINDQRQWGSPTSATYENQALTAVQ